MYYFFIKIISLQNILTINFLYQFLSKLRAFNSKNSINYILITFSYHDSVKLSFYSDKNNERTIYYQEDGKNRKPTRI